MSEDLLKKHPELAMPPSTTLLKAMQTLTKTRVGMLLAVDGRRRLLGVGTDIDIRKALLRGEEMSIPIGRVINKNPIVVSSAASREEIAEEFRKTGKAFIPIVGPGKKLAGLASYSDYATIAPRHPNWVVIMAGGLGKRLLPLTVNTPKPMVRLGDKPILEFLLDQLIASGFGHFVFTVNYLGEQIRKHFGDGSRWDVQIEYVQETKPLGTAGALSMVRRDFKAPLLLVNGDILTKIDFNALLAFHKAEEALATLCVKRHEIQVPYGVIELNDHRLHEIQEKPVHRFLVNAGIYVLEPKVLPWLSRNKRCDMPDFINTIRRRRAGPIACFPIQEYWLDIGGHENYQRAAGEYERVFEAS